MEWLISLAFVPEVKYCFTEIFRPCTLLKSFQTVDISSKTFFISTKKTNHEDIVTMVSICRGTSCVLHEWWVGCSGLEVGRKYGCVKEHVAQAGFIRLILILCHGYKEASSRHDICPQTLDHLKASNGVYFPENEWKTGCSISLLF